MENSITSNIKAPLTEKKVEYEKATLTSRIFANLLDIVILIFTFFLCIIPLREIATNTPKYKTIEKEVRTLKLESGLYKDDKNGVLTDATYIIETASEYNNEARKVEAVNIINRFFTFAENHFTSEQCKIIKDDFDSFRLDESMKYDSKPMFLTNNEIVVENSEIVTDTLGNSSVVYKTYYEKCYKVFIEKKLVTYFISYTPNYVKLQNFIWNVLIFAELIPSAVLSFLITYLLPALIFKRGRQTFGKRLYHIASVKRNCITPGFGKYFAKLGLILLEFILALPSFCVTLLISFSMMLFSKDKQPFPDYFLDLIDIQVTDKKIYMNSNEVDLDSVETHKEAIKFTPKN